MTGIWSAAELMKLAHPEPRTVGRKVTLLKSRTVFKIDAKI